MSHVRNLVGVTDHREGVSADQSKTTEVSRPRPPGPGESAGRRSVPLVAGIIACVFAAILLTGGGWALWKDRVDRDTDGFVSIGSSTLRTETYVNEEGLVEHNQHVMDARAVLFEKYAFDHRMTAFGEISPQLRDLGTKHAGGLAVYSFLQGLEAAVAT